MTIKGIIFVDPKIIGDTPQKRKTEYTERRHTDHIPIQSIYIYIYTLKIKFSRAKMDPNNGKSSGYNVTQSSKKNATVIPKKKEHVSTKVGKKIAEVAKDALKKNNDKAKVSPTK
ncbi:hypothetical protein CDL12_26820 [Handroanthus impetiginosus]|uniref:Uncharacterized protein n=1 Tax=Handroanthus impetiginosus TaxID=429701 RepID=A0A2G9G5T9_9LAMI|nr:hypothetical protein CDL12_26820 [Handroanthus impetiginosus]